MNHTINKLISRLETAIRGNQILSEEVLLTLGWKWECVGCPGGGMWKNTQQTFHCGPLPDVTEQIEAARTLIPDNIFVANHEGHQSNWTVQLYTHPLNDGKDYEDPIVTAHARTLSLALCSAVVKLQLSTRIEISTS